MIYIDVSAAVHGKAGLGRYSEQIANSLISGQNDQFGLFFNQGRDGHLPSTLEAVPYRTVKWGFKPWRLAVLAAHLTTMTFNRFVPEATLFHSTEHLLMPLRDVPTVLTVHDLIFKLFPHFHKKLNYYYLNMAMPIFCRRASAIIAVSNATRMDIVTNYGIDSDKIHVVYEAAASHFKPQSQAEIDRVRKKFKLPDQYLIHIGTIEPRKNLERLLEALILLQKENPNLCLVLAGSRGWLNDNFFAKLESTGLQNKVQLLGWVANEDLPAVIAGADLAVQPSLYEGFGLPLLEHMACGQVVTASSTSCHPEIGGEAALYFDPVDVDQMAIAIYGLLKDGEERENRRQLGLQRSESFSWQRAARETYAIYQRLLNNK